MRDPDAEHLPLIEESRNALIEGIIAESEDETLMERYLEGEDIETSVHHRRPGEGGRPRPLLPGDPGVRRDAASASTRCWRCSPAAFPSPLEHPLPAVAGVDGSPREPLTCDPDGPLVAEVVKTTIDSYVGRVSLVRVFSGTLRPESVVHISGHGMSERGHPDHDADERIAHLYSPLGATLREVPRCVAGDICAITKSTTAETGDTISGKDNPLLIEPWEMPEPLLPVAIVAKTRSDEDALAKNLGRLVAGDPTLRLERNAETHQLVLWCMGEAHADVVLDRLRVRRRRPRHRAGEGGAARDVRRRRRRGTAGTSSSPAGTASTPSATSRSSRCRAAPASSSSTRSSAAWCRTTTSRPWRRASAPRWSAGIVAGHPVVDVRVTLVDGKAHSVDSSDAAFQTAGALALQGRRREGAGRAARTGRRGDDPGARRSSSAR